MIGLAFTQKNYILFSKNRQSFCTMDEKRGAITCISGVFTATYFDNVVWFWYNQMAASAGTRMGLDSCNIQKSSGIHKNLNGGKENE